MSSYDQKLIFCRDKRRMWPDVAYFETSCNAVMCSKLFCSAANGRWPPSYSSTRTRAAGEVPNRPASHLFFPRYILLRCPKGCTVGISPAEGGQSSGVAPIWEA